MLHMFTSLDRSSVLLDPACLFLIVRHYRLILTQLNKMLILK